jgi:hypothetical protein
LHQGTFVRAAALLALSLTGCFYVESINQRPGLDIRQDSAGAIYRGESVTLTAVASDPESHIVEFNWNIYACTDASDFEGSCDKTPIHSGTIAEATFVVPKDREDPDGAGPEPAPAVKSLRVMLDGKDEYGATAKPGEQLILPVLDRSPEFGEVRQPVSAYDFVVDTDVHLYAEFTDGDDPLDSIALEWVVFPPSQVPITLIDETVEQDPMRPAYRQIGKELAGNAVGNWDIQLTARDPDGQQVVQHFFLTMKADRAPCLNGLQPVVPPPTAAYPMTDATLFQVPMVDDDLDRHPRAFGEHYGDPRFVWSLLAPGGGGRQVLGGATGNSVLLDPANYMPGSLLELRVEIFDRNDIAITCTDGDPTCAVDAQEPSCLQRQTWRIEVQ